MAKSLKTAQQELDRQRAMYRSMPNEKDEAALDLARRIEGLKSEIARLQNAPSRRPNHGLRLALLVLLAFALGGAAFAAAYFGGRLLTG